MTVPVDKVELPGGRCDMKSNSKKFSVSSALKKIRNGSLDLDPEYQRGAVWGKPRKALLVDSMLRGYDLPKIYLRETPSQGESYEVVDGVQRLTAMDDFARGEFPLPKTAEFGGYRYQQLPESAQERFDDYQLDFTILADCSDEEVREMFLRLQQGVRLNTAEELRAVSGDMNEFVESLVASRFFEKTACFTKSRGSRRHVAAQIAKLALVGVGDARKSDLMKFYSDNREWSPNSIAAQLKTSLNWLHTVFGDTHPVFRNRAQSVSVSFLAFALWNSYALKDHEAIFRQAIEKFDSQVANGEQTVRDYATAMSHSSDQGGSIQLRHEFLLAALKPALEKIPSKDSQRQFKTPERVTAWYEANGHCQAAGCGMKVSFADFHADHQKAWSRGGKTNIDNLQVLCSRHNLSKGAR